MDWIFAHDQKKTELAEVESWVKMITFRSIIYDHTGKVVLYIPVEW